MIDWSHVDEMKVEMGDDFDEVVAMFLSEVGDVIQRLELDSTASTIAADLHFLKGAALNLGFCDFASLCASAEKLAASGEAGAVDLPDVLACYRASCQAFRQGPG